MKWLAITLLLFPFLVPEPAGAEPSRHWPLDSTEPSNLTLRGSAAAAEGIDENQSLALDGVSILRFLIQAR